MKHLVLALLFTSTTAFAGTSMNKKSYKPCKSLVNNTMQIVTLKPILSARGPIHAGEQVVFAAFVEGRDAGMCVARVTVRAGKLVVMGVEKAMKAGMCVVEGAANLLWQILRTIFG